MLVIPFYILYSLRTLSRYPFPPFPLLLSLACFPFVVGVSQLVERLLQHSSLISEFMFMLRSKPVWRKLRLTVPDLAPVGHELQVLPAHLEFGWLLAWSSLVPGSHSPPLADSPG